MRWFFILLTLTNLILAGWLYWQAEVAPQPELAQAMHAPEQKQLVLLREQPQQTLRPIPPVAVASEEPSTTNDHALIPTDTATPAQAAAEQKTTSQPGPLTTCLQISPLAKLADVELLTRKLEKINLTVLDSGEGVTERLTYWVMIPPYKTNKLARDASAQLAKARVRDFLIVRSGEFENGISLGLFSQKEGAENRLREILALDLNIRRPEIRLRSTSASSHWVITRVSDQETLKALQPLIDNEGLQSSPVECPQ